MTFPKFLQQKPPILSIELVPSTTWGANLRAVLHPDHWKELRTKNARKAGYRCEICGGKGSKWPVECHEIWHYDDKTKKQSLLGLISLCPPCHRVKHMGHAHIIGKGDDAREHLAKTNQWSQSEASQYIAAVFAQWEERSKYEWELDISWLNQN